MTAYNARKHGKEGTMIQATQQIQDLIRRGALFVINHSGGKDSQCMTIEMAGLIPAPQLLVIHAHLPKVEWRGTWDHVKTTAAASLPDVPVIKVVAVKSFLEMVDRRQNWPSPQYRQCTSDLKRGPITKEIRRVIKDENLNGIIVNCMGIRAEESSARAKKNPFKYNKRNSKAGREWYDWMPIFHHKIQQVWDAIKTAGQVRHWAYEKGMTRLSCCFCIMASKHDIKISAQENPELFQELLATEKRIGKTIFMKKGTPMALDLYIQKEEN